MVSPKLEIEPTDEDCPVKISIHGFEQFPDDHREPPIPESFYVLLYTSAKLMGTDGPRAGAGPVDSLSHVRTAPAKIECPRRLRTHVTLLGPRPLCSGGDPSFINSRGRFSTSPRRYPRAGQTP